MPIKWGRRRKAQWTRKGRPVRSRVPVGSELMKMYSKSVPKRVPQIASRAGIEIVGEQDVRRFNEEKRDRLLEQLEMQGYNWYPELRAYPYSGADKETAERLGKELRDKGFDVKVFLHGGYYIPKEKDPSISKDQRTVHFWWILAKPARPFEGQTQVLDVTVPTVYDLPITHDSHTYKQLIEQFRNQGHFDIHIRQLTHPTGRQRQVRVEVESKRVVGG